MEGVEEEHDVRYDQTGMMRHGTPAVELDAMGFAMDEDAHADAYDPRRAEYPFDEEDGNPEHMHIHNNINTHVERDVAEDQEFDINGYHGPMLGLDGEILVPGNLGGGGLQEDEDNEEAPDEEAPDEDQEEEDVDEEKEEQEDDGGNDDDDDDDDDDEVDEEEQEDDDEEEEEEEEEESVDNRTDAELAAIALELQDLEQSVPLLKTSYHLLDRLGEGTFSSVYKAIDLHHHLYDNSQWAPLEEEEEEEIAEAPAPPVSSDARFHPSTSTSSCSGSVIGDPSSSARSLPRPARDTAAAMVVYPPHHPFASEDPFDASVGDQARNKFTETLQRHALESGKLPTAYKANPNHTPRSNPLLTNNPHSIAKKKPNPNVYVALKRIYVTSSPYRIMNELKLLSELRDAEHVAYLIQAIRHEDQVIAVMPYRKHQDFRDYYRIAPISMIRKYMYCLFSALKDTHAKGIIHRDIKPANFLFDIHSETGVLCDFGLAEKFEAREWHGKCLHSLPEPKMDNFHGKLMDHPKPTLDQMQEQWRRWRAKLARYRASFVQQLGRPLEDISELTETPAWRDLFMRRPFDTEPDDDAEVTYEPPYEWYEAWRPVSKIGGLWGGGYGRRKPTAAAAAAAASSSTTTTNIDSVNSTLDRVGFKRDDPRPSAKANRAGTRGFRAPEVLFKCPDQTGAIDIWSVGVTLLCFLTRRFPFFNSNDDVDALMEIATIFGRSKLEGVAIHHNRTVISNIPEVNAPRFSSLHTLVRTLNPSLYEEERLRVLGGEEGGVKGGGAAGAGAVETKQIERLTTQIFQAHRELTSAVETLGQDLNPYGEPWYLRSELWYLVDLLKRTLELDCTKRITAAHALGHKFFTLFS
ncbi:hypothetical protein PCASD_16109 [Puccinia coronata f. sp. avenae]|uniref:non-specific serine/threonine protein kinase n=1 Tax=Puccinia coronata f. sp. avenae TaxID=200324 RepID=A0A2N5TXX6_9BASI|nr:hypothetical protein PCASD_24725 [Puccinia coronata f. sp. avenae]PLW30353.1 hypothetical protein PCASD_16109 [Puccinia coronata f. sp. avenae]